MAVMNPVALWLLQQSGGLLFGLAQQFLAQRMGLTTSSPTITQPLLDEYLDRLKSRLDEDRISELFGALSQLRDASNSAARTELLSNAITAFNKITSMPRSGITGGHSNSELICIAYLGLGAAHSNLNDNQELIAEKLVNAIYTDPTTARKWIGDNIVHEVLSIFAPFPHEMPIEGSRPSISKIIPPQDWQQIIARPQKGVPFDMLSVPKTKDAVERTFLYGYSDVVLSIYFALPVLKKTVVAAHDIPEGAIVEAKQAKTLASAPVSLLFKIVDERQSGTRVTGVCRFMGQINVLGTGKATLNRIYSLAQNFLSTKYNHTTT